LPVTATGWNVRSSYWSGLCRNALWLYARQGTKTMLVCKDNIILMSVSVPDNEIVCYSVDNAISNAKVTGASPPLKSGGPSSPHFRRLWVCHGSLQWRNETVTTHNVKIVKNSLFLNSHANSNSSTLSLASRPLCGS